MLDKTKTRRLKAQATLYLTQNIVNKMNDIDSNYCNVKTNMAEIVTGKIPQKFTVLSRFVFLS